MQAPVRRPPIRVAVAVTALLITAVASGAHLTSASTLGTFDDVTFEAATFPVEACTADGTIYDSTLSLIPLGSSLASLLQIGYVELDAVTAGCSDAVPTVLIIGDNVLAGQFNTILAEIPLAAPASEPDLLYDVTSLGLTLPLGSVVDEVRVALTPA